jgi:hypothetical protein
MLVLFILLCLYEIINVLRCLKGGLSKHEAGEDNLYNLCLYVAMSRNMTIDIINTGIKSISLKTRINTVITIILIQDNSHKAEINNI